MGVKNYLVVKSRLGDRRGVVYNYGSNAVGAGRDYTVLEYSGAECVLLGSDSLETLAKTHANWVDEETEERVILI